MWKANSKLYLDFGLQNYRKFVFSQNLGIGSVGFCGIPKQASCIPALVSLISPMSLSFDFLQRLRNKEFAFSAGATGSIPGLGRFPGGGRGNPLQYS